jgi:transcriptional regulator with XRE-family HTH domain
MVESSSANSTCAEIPLPAREWSQERLAEASGLNTVQISHIENGRNEPKLRTILALAKAFGVRPGELLTPFR